MPDDKRVAIDDLEKIEFVKSGASGDVWLAKPKRDLGFANAGQPVALKLYKPDLLSEPGQRQRITEEYRTGSSLVHPNLVQIFYVDIEKDPPFMIMEWCEGENLADWRTKNGEPTEDFLLRFATELLEAIEYLHSSRRCHRDIKPANIHVDVQGKIRLLDYGIIRSFREPPITRDEAGRFVGTYRYSAPEYIFADEHYEFSYPADLYSFGAVLFFLLHGYEVFAAAKKTPDLLRAKQAHDIRFDTKLRGKGPIWKALFDLSRRLLEHDVRNRCGSALAGLDFLAKEIPEIVPLRCYFACSLTRPDADSRKRTETVGKIIRSAATDHGFSLYLPGEHTHPLSAPKLSAPEVYWIDRERVASSDLLVIYADDPSFGVGQEAEIAANASVFIVIFRSSGIDVSRMLRGIAGRLIGEIEFNDHNELLRKAGDFFKSHQARLNLWRKTREREYTLRLGNRVKEARERAQLTSSDLSERSGVNREMIEALESRPETQSGMSLTHLRQLAKALGIAPAELLKDQGGKEQLIEDLYRESIAVLRDYAVKHQLSYQTYAQLKERGGQVIREQVYSQAARGTPRALDSQFWSDLLKELL